MRRWSIPSWTAGLFPTNWYPFSTDEAIAIRWNTPIDTLDFASHVTLEPAVDSLRATWYDVVHVNAEFADRIAERIPILLKTCYHRFGENPWRYPLPEPRACFPA